MIILQDGQEYVLRVPGQKFWVNAYQDRDRKWQLVCIDERRQFLVSVDGAILDADAEVPKPTGATVRDLIPA